jgi:Uma2 family endonuclease
VSEQTLTTWHPPIVPRIVPKDDPFRLGWRNVLKRDENGLVQLTPIPLTLEDVLYPEDGDVIVSNEYHAEDCIYLRNALRLALNGRPDALVLKETHTDFGLEGVKPIVPDVTVFSGVTGDRDRMKTFYPGRIGARPELVIEITSPSTRSIDLNTKPMIYCRAGVPVYAVVDSWMEMEERVVMLVAYRLTPEGYVRVPTDERGRIWLEPVRLWLAPEKERVVLIDEQGQRVPAPEELARSLKQSDAKNEELQSEAEANILAKREAEKKAAEADKARKEAEDRAAEEVTARQEAQDRATAEAKARKEADDRSADLLARLAEMEAEMRRLRGETPPG